MCIAMSTEKFQEQSKGACGCHSLGNQGKASQEFLQHFPGLQIGNCFHHSVLLCSAGPGPLDLFCFIVFLFPTTKISCAHHRTPGKYRKSRREITTTPHRATIQKRPLLNCCTYSHCFYSAYFIYF